MTQDLLGVAAVGTRAAWRVAFHPEVAGTVVPDATLTLTETDCDARVIASMPGGLDPGAYTIRLAGLADAQHAALIAPDAPTVVRLWLSWRDAAVALGDVAPASSSAGAPLAELAIVRVGRVAEAGRVWSVVTARERVYDALARARMGTAISAPDALAAAAQTAAPFVDVRAYAGGLPVPTTVGLGPGSLTPPVIVERGRVALDILRELGPRLEQATQRYGRGVYLLRAGVLHVGQRPIPLDGPPRSVDALSGLLDVRAVSAAAGLRQYILLLKGRPDIRPGDVVTAPVDGPVAGAPLAHYLGTTGALGATSGTSVYVAAVTHEIGAARGFVTTLLGVGLDDLADVWESAPTPALAAQTPVARAAQAVRDVVAATAATRRLLEVAEVRSAVASGAAEPPGQTTTVWRGIGAGDGAPNAARRLPVAGSAATALPGTPYVTPFAWGKCGLVLPRYPGTRVVVGHRDGAADDPIDLGAVWPSGHGPNAQAGDWWLGLPVDVPQPASVPDGAEPNEPSGKATNDLIDGAGNRVIEVGTLRVRVGKDGLAAPGTRPQASGDFVSIEHSDGTTKLVVTNDGTVHIVAAKDVVIQAENSLTVTSPDITLGDGSSTVKVPGNLKVG